MINISGIRDKRRIWWADTTLDLKPGAHMLRFEVLVPRTQDKLFAVFLDAVVLTTDESFNPPAIIPSTRRNLLKTNSNLANKGSSAINWKSPNTAQPWPAHRSIWERKLPPRGRLMSSARAPAFIGNGFPARGAVTHSFCNLGGRSMPGSVASVGEPCNPREELIRTPSS